MKLYNMERLKLYGDIIPSGIFPTLTPDGNPSFSNRIEDFRRNYLKYIYYERTSGQYSLNNGYYD